MAATADRCRPSPAQNACWLFYQHAVAQYEFESTPIWKDMSCLKLIDRDGNLRHLAVENWTKSRFMLMKVRERQDAAKQLSDTNKNVKSLITRLESIWQSLEEDAFFLHDMTEAKFSIPLNENPINLWGLDLLEKQDLIEEHLVHLRSSLGRIKELAKILSGIDSPSEAPIDSSSELPIEESKNSPSNSEQYSVLSVADVKKTKLSTRPKIGFRLSLDKLKKQQEKDLRENKSEEIISPYGSPNSDTFAMQRSKHKRRSLANFPSPE